MYNIYKLHVAILHIIIYIVFLCVYMYASQILSLVPVPFPFSVTNFSSSFSYPKSPVNRTIAENTLFRA